jgi:hypothetical protein
MMTQLELDQIVAALAPIITPRAPPYLIGQQLYCQQSVTAWTTAGLVVQIPANANRVCLMIATSNNLTCYVSLASQTTNFVGMPIQQGNNPLFLNINDHGPLPQQSLYVYAANAGPGNLIVIETIWKPTD